MLGIDPFFRKGLPTTFHRESMVHDFDISLGRLDYDGTHLARVPGHILNTLASEWRIGLMDTEQTPDSDVVASLLYCTAYNPVSCLGGERIWPEHCLLNFEASVLYINPMQIQVKALV